MTNEEWYEYEIGQLNREIEYWKGIVDRQNKIRRELSSYLIREREHINVITALNIIYPAEPGKGKVE